MLPLLALRHTEPTAQVNPWMANYRRDLLEAKRRCEEGDASGVVAELKKQVEVLKARVDTLKKQNQELGKKSNAAQFRLNDQLFGKLASSEKSNRKLKQELAKKEEELNLLEVAAQLLAKEITNAENVIEKAKTVESLEVGDLQAQIDILKVENEGLRSYLDDLRKLGEEWLEEQKERELRQEER